MRANTAQRETKQVIVLRKDLNMRKGKMIAQGAHASMQAILNQGKFGPGHIFTLDLSRELENWLYYLYTKICVGVNSEEELLAIYEKAKELGLNCSLIEDYGFTEFNNIKTYTAVCIGPNYSEDIDKVTGHLTLL